jgi:hypothetical protein
MWLPIGGFSLGAIYFLFIMVFNDRYARWLKRSRQGYSKSLRAFYDAISLGHWENEEAIKSGSFVVGIFGFFVCVAVLVVIFMGHPAP